MFEFLTRAKTIAGDAHNTIAEIKAELANQKSTREALLAQKDDLFLQPLAKEDIKKIIFDYIDRQAQLYLEGGGMSDIINGLALPSRRIGTANAVNARNAALNLYDLDNGVKPSGFFEAYIFNFENLPIFNGYAFSHGAKTDLCFFFGDVIKKKIEDHFDAFFPTGWDSYKPGLALAARRPIIADLEAQIASVDAIIEDFESHLRDLSLSAKV